MRNGRHLHYRISRIATLQTLKAMSSRGELAEAQAETTEARERLDQGQREVAAKEGEVEALLNAEALDFARWRIALAVLGDLSNYRDLAAETVHECDVREAERREQWRQDHVREERSTALLRKLTRRMADKRDDAAILEAASLRPILRGNET